MGPALTGLLAAKSDATLKEDVKYAYKIADAILEARK